MLICFFVYVIQDKTLILIKEFTQLFNQKKHLKELF